MGWQANFKAAHHGFSLIEILVAISIAVVFLSISVTAYNSIRHSNNIELAGLEIIEALRYAQTSARAVKEDDAWGVKMNDGTIVIFKGDDYAGRDTAFDQTLRLSSRVTFAGLDEVVFHRVTGFPQTTGSVVISIHDASKHIEINEQGTILH